MTIPIDLPGGHKLGELSSPGPVMQPGVQQSEGGGFRGIVLLGATPQAGISTHVCESVRASSDEAYADALDYIARNKEPLR